MLSNKIYLVTGANRGIGLGLTTALLLRPKTTVVATVRSVRTSTTDLEAVPVAEGSKRLILHLASDSDTSAKSLVSSLPGHGINHIDTIIANAGSGTTFHTTEETTLAALRSDFEVNTLGPIKLFQAAHPLLKASKKAEFVVISSVLGSITLMDEYPNLSYGVSKAAVNYFVKKVHLEHAEIKTLAIQPGWVKTANGQNYADSIGHKEPPMALDESVKSVLALIDALAESSQTSGSFKNDDGRTIPW